VIRSDRGSDVDTRAPTVSLALTHPAERALALRLARLREAVDAVAAELAPHVLCTYLYDLAAEFMRFYESCPVLAAPDEASRLSRMRLCDLTARCLRGQLLEVRMRKAVIGDREAVVYLAHLVPAEACDFRALVGKTSQAAPFVQTGAEVEGRARAVPPQDIGESNVGRYAVVPALHHGQDTPRHGRTLNAVE